MKFRLSHFALKDLEAIFDYTQSQWGTDQANHYADQLWDQFEVIARNPERHRRRDDVYPGCRIVYQGRHAILYRIHEGRVEIARILHEAMDFKRHVPGEYLER